MENLWILQKWDSLSNKLIDSFISFKNNGVFLTKFFKKHECSCALFIFVYYHWYIIYLKLKFKFPLFSLLSNTKCLLPWKQLLRFGEKITNILIFLDIDS